VKKIITLLIVLISYHGQSQKQTTLPYEFGKVQPEEIQMRKFSKDTTANALVLYEHGNIEFKQSGSRNYFTNTVYRKIKILNEKGYDHATVKVYLYKSDSGDKETIQNIKAVTYNSPNKKTILTKEQIFTTSLDDKYDEVTFTFPNVKPGSVVEYQYEVKSEFFFNLVGWSFQSSIPKLHSEFHAVIPGFWIYNRHLNGSLRLSVNKADLKNNCFEIRGARANCEDLTYSIQDVPAFIEEEKYSTSKKNYISKIEFELARINRTDGTTKEFTSSWIETDKYLEDDSSVGKQLKLSSYFKKSIPKEVFKIKDDHKRAMSVYYYIQNHFQLDKDNYHIMRNVNTKKAYDEKYGSNAEINLALINTLRAAGLNAEIMLLSTRDNGVPTKNHPVLSDFNYMVTFLKIDDRIILLDPSDRFMSFGQTPFKTLNGQGRVLDFENGSYWYSTTPKVSSMEIRDINLKLDEFGTLNGNISIKSQGYEASSKRELIDEMSEDDYLDYLETSESDMMVENYNNEQLKELDSTLIETFDLEFDVDKSMTDEIYLNAFLYQYNNNPFQLEERTYPVNFGYKINNITKTSIELPPDYKIKNLPETVHIRLPNNGGSFQTTFSERDHKIFVFSNLKLNYVIYNPEKYKLLKEMFKEIIKTNNSLISLEKTTGS